MALFNKTKKLTTPKPETETASGPVPVAAPNVAAPHHIVLGVLKRPHMSEKAHNHAAQNQYAFVVHDSANKRLVKHAIEHQYHVNVTQVNIIREKRKAKHWRNAVGSKPIRKKAFVTVKEGQKIEIV